VIGLILDDGYCIKAGFVQSLDETAKVEIPLTDNGALQLAIALENKSL
jgi:hypothetical protein